MCSRLERQMEGSMKPTCEELGNEELTTLKSSLTEEDET